MLYTPWCDERGKVIDDGTVARLDETSYRLTAADPSYRWLSMNAHGLDVEVGDTSESLGALALQGPFSRDVLAAASEESWDDVGYFRRRAGRIAGVEIDVSRTGYTGDLGYELWMPADQALKVWDRLIEVGEDYAPAACGIRAMDVARVEAGLILIEVDYTSVRHAMTPSTSTRPASWAWAGWSTTTRTTSSAAGHWWPSAMPAARRGAWSGWSWPGRGSRRRSPSTTCRPRSRPR